MSSPGDEARRLRLMAALRVATAALSICGALAACTNDEGLLLVDLRTDLLPGQEFELVSGKTLGEDRRSHFLSLAIYRSLRDAILPHNLLVARHLKQATIVTF